MIDLLVEIVTKCRLSISKIYQCENDIYLKIAKKYKIVTFNLLLELAIAA